MLEHAPLACIHTCIQLTHACADLVSTLQRGYLYARLLRLIAPEYVEGFFDEHDHWADEPLDWRQLLLGFLQATCMYTHMCMACVWHVYTAATRLPAGNVQGAAGLVHAWRTVHGARARARASS